MLAIAQQAMEYAAHAGNLELICMGMVLSNSGTLACQELAFNEQGLCHNAWKALLIQNAGVVALWQSLCTKTWLNRCLSTSLEHASFSDVLFFLIYMWCHPTLSVARSNVWKACGQHCLPNVLNNISQWLTAFARHLANQVLQHLPALTTKSGRARRAADPVNKLLLLWKLRKEKLHRKRVADTHDYGSQATRMIAFENYIDSLLYLQMLESTFGGSTSQQISVCWDPSSYGGKDTYIGVVYDPEKNLAAFLPSQQLSQVMMSDLEQGLLPLAKSRKLTRLEGFKELKGLSSSLRGIGIDITDFKVPEGLFCRPLEAGEYRLVGPNGVVYVLCEQGTLVPQVPAHLDLGALPCLLSVSDQGPNNTASLNYCMFSKQALLFWGTWDPFHRAWNDIKGAFKKTQCRAWRVVLEMSLVANMNYGPFGSSSWFYKKRAKLEQLLLTTTVGSTHWQQFQHLIAMERRQQEPRTGEEAQSLLDSMASLESFLNKGPLIKLMRWFSFFESMLFHNGDWWATKMVILHGAGDEGGAGESGEDDVDMEQLAGHEDHRKELQELKKRKGTWKLAPQLINHRNLAIKDCILSVGRATWKHFAERSRQLLSPAHILEYNISCAFRSYWVSELADMIGQSLWDPRNLDHVLPKWCMHSDALIWHTDIFDSFVEARSMSLAAFHCMPPALYHHLLSPIPSVARAAHDLALKHYKHLLAAEEAVAGGADVQPLDSMYWRLNPLIRSIYLAFEQDEAQQLVLTAGSKALRLQRVLAKNLGDSRLIENTHQHGRDLYRSSKASSFSNPTIFANALRSGTLEERKVPRLKVSEQDKATAGAFRLRFRDSVNSKLRSQGHKLPKDMQLMMVPKSKTHTWPSPAPSSLFSSAAATQWLFTFYGAENNSPLKAEGVNGSWVSLLARAGRIVGQSSTGRLIKVLATAEFGFLGADILLLAGADGQRHFVCSKDRKAVQWHHVVDLDDWFALPVEPSLVNAQGPLGWKKVGDPLVFGGCLLPGWCAAGLPCHQEAHQEIGWASERNSIKKSFADAID